VRETWNGRLAASHAVPFGFTRVAEMPLECGKDGGGQPGGSCMGRLLRVMKQSRRGTRQGTPPGLPAKRSYAIRPFARISRESKGLALAGRNLATRVAGFEIADQSGADLAGRWRQEIDAQEQKILDWFAPAKQAAFKAHAAICRQENEALAPYREARRLVNGKLAAWQKTQAQLTTPGEAAPDAGAPESCGQSGAQVAGINFRENWRIEVVDKVALIRAIAARPELVNLLDPNQTALNHLARAHKNTLELAGVRVWCELTVAASRRS
jgi:hypothetical protein